MRRSKSRSSSRKIYHRNPKLCCPPPRAICRSFQVPPLRQSHTGAWRISKALCISPDSIAGLIPTVQGITGLLDFDACGVFASTDVTSPRCSCCGTSGLSPQQRGAALKIKTSHQQGSGLLWAAGISAGSLGWIFITKADKYLALLRGCVGSQALWLSPFSDHS